MSLDSCNHNGATSFSYYYGIIQIWYNGQWGNICDDIYFNQHEADVICHQLGYTGASGYNRVMRLVCTSCVSNIQCCVVMIPTLTQCYRMMSTVLTTTSLFYSVHSLHTLIVDV